MYLLGVYPDLKNGTQNGFHRYLSDTEVASLHTAFIISYTVCSPIFGYLGDRFIRKRLMGAGVILWSSFAAAGSFAPVRQYISVIAYDDNCYITELLVFISDEINSRDRRS